MFKSSSSSSSMEIPDCVYLNQPILIPPEKTTPTHSLYLSNLDDQKFLRFSIKYLYVYNKSIPIDKLKSSLSKVLFHYYPLAGRLKISGKNKEKLQLDCNGEGALFSVAFMDVTVNEFLATSTSPNISWKKLLYRVNAQNFSDIPPLVIQVTKLRCGGMILCIAINHCTCDGIGTSQFLHAWAHFTTNPDADFPPVQPFHTRDLLTPRKPPQIPFYLPVFTNTTPKGNFEISQILQSQHLVPVSLTFSNTAILHLNKSCAPSLKCTTFDTLASHVWRSWIKSFNPPSSLKIKLLFSVNIRNKIKPELPNGYYGNGFVLGCAETTVEKLVNANVHHGVKLIQEAKNRLNDEYIRGMIDFLEEEHVKPDLSSSFVISQWSKIGLEDLDFGEGKAVDFGPVCSEIYCLFLPVVGDLDAVKVVVSVPESVVEKFVCYMRSDLCA